MAGQLLLSMTLVVCLYCSVRATGSQPPFAAVAVAFLIGDALGSASPTPAGVVGVEAATAGLLAATTGLGSTGAALGPVVLFRLTSLVLPVLPGWFALGRLQRHKAI